MNLIIVGYGNMAKGIISGLIREKKDKLKISKIIITGRAPKKIESWINNIKDNGEFSNDITYKESMTVECDKSMVLLACKPNNLKEFEFKGVAEMVYSVLAGVKIEILKEYINSHHYILMMPNMAAMYGLSSTSVLWINNLRATSIQKAGEVLDILMEVQNKEYNICKHEALKEQIKTFVESFGNCIFVESQKELNASIATNGSSPAIIALVAQSLIDAGIYSGLKLEQSASLVQKTMEGVAQMLKHKTPQEIKDSITSPGGTTARALLHCNEHSVQGHITRACIKAVERAK